MKDGIKAGDYIRTINGTIAKIEYEEFELTYSLISSKMLYRHWINRDECRLEIISKHSPNIIDLIEEGDLIKYKLKNFNQTKIRQVEKQIDPRSKTEALRIEFYRIDQVEILKIITKEEFSNVGYEVTDV